MRTIACLRKRCVPDGRDRRPPFLRCAGVLCVVAVGCDLPPHVRETRDAPVFDDITNIITFVRPVPWINFDSSDPTKVNGIAINMYLYSARAQKGVFGSGTIRVIMYEDVSFQKDKSGKAPSPDGKKTGEKLHEWELPPDKAMAYRVVRRPDREYVLGDAYQLRLSWGDTDLKDRHVAIVLEYQRTDGQIVRRKPFFRRIPRSVGG